MKRRQSSESKPAAGKLRGGLITGLIAVIVMVAGRGIAIARSFGAPVALATDDLAGYRVSNAIDANADAIALWSGQFSDRPAGGGWSDSQSFGGTGSPTQTVHMTAAGDATAVWVASTTDVMSADLPRGGTWSTPIVVATASGAPAPLFVMDSKGDAGIVFVESGEIVAYRRAAGSSAWGSREVVTTAPVGSHVQLSGAAMGEAGDFAVAWQTFEVKCSRFCHDVNFVLHVSREQLAGMTWDDSGALTAGTNLPGYTALPAVDGKGRAAVVYVAPFGAIVSSRTQAKYGAAWGKAATAYTASSGALLAGVNVIAANGHLTVAALDLSATGTSVVAFDGKIATNTWHPATTLSNLASGDSSGVVALMSFGGSTNGAAVAEWGDGDGTIRAAVRRSGTAAWGATQTINGPVPCGTLGPTCSGPLAASINNKGHAIVIFATSDPQLTSFAIFAASE